MQVRYDVPLAQLTTLRLGGPARRLLDAATDDELVAAVAAAGDAGERVLVVAGGSNLVIADAGFGGTVVRVATRGARASAGGGREGRVSLEVAAGEPWDQLVARCVAEGLSGLECLSGIPGSTGATPIQNVGAYGQEVSDTIASVRVYDTEHRAVRTLRGAECAFAYRGSAFRRSPRFVVLGVTFVLERSSLARPIRYAELARTLSVAVGARPPLSAVREAVLALRCAKGMVVDPRDPDSVSAGSFFVNPVLSADELAALQSRVAERLDATVSAPAWPGGDGNVKTSAAWLIEHAGFHRGYGAGRVGVSRKHTLALINRGGATTGELLALARELRDGVRDAFGVTLRPEPTLVGVEL
ncbi:MAG: UDP-N-acetylmuramate dehydrogenase [Solirubrobacteraceae bacterium]|jgi:UDP-N-acetylmuramate dehydrogenase